MKNKTIQWRHYFILNGFKFWMYVLCIVSKPPIVIIFCVRSNRLLHCETWRNSFISRILQFIFNLLIVYLRNFLFTISKFCYSENTCIRRLGASWRKLNSTSYFILLLLKYLRIIWLEKKKQEAEVLALCIPMSSDVYQSPGCNSMLYLEHA